MPIVAQGGAVTLSAVVGHSNGSPADDPDLTLTLLDAGGDPVAGFPVAIPPIVRDGLGLYHFDWSVPALLATGDYTATWSATVDGADAGGSEVVEVVSPGMVTASLVSPDQVRALVPSTLTDPQLQDVIDREEAALARQITDLAGSRTQAYWIGSPAQAGVSWDTAAMACADGRLPYSSLWMTNDRMGPLGLLRPTDAVSVRDNGLAVSPGDIRLLRQGTLVERASTGWTGPLVEVTYTPNDLLEVQRVVIELCRMTLTETGYQSEQISDYRYAKHLRPGPGEPDPRKALIRSLTTHLPKGTMRIRTQAEDDRIGAVTP